MGVTVRVVKHTGKKIEMKPMSHKGILERSKLERIIFILLPCRYSTFFKIC